MSLRRFLAVFGRDLAHNARRSLFWVWVLLLLLLAWTFSTGAAKIQSGDSSVGGTKAHITSEFGDRVSARHLDGDHLRLLRRRGRGHGGDPRRRVPGQRAAARHAAAAGRVHLGQVRSRWPPRR